MRIPSGVTDQYIYFVAVDATDLNTRETGFSSFTVYRSRNGGAAAAMTTPTINETDSSNMPGVYELLLDEDMTIGSGNDSEEMCFHITHSGMAPVTRTIELYRTKITAGNTLGVASDGDISGDVDGHVDGSIGSLATQAKADVNAEADTAISDAALATASALATAQADLDTLTGADGVTLATAQGNYAPAKAGDQMALADDAITSGKYDESTAFPLKSDDSGASQVARVGADGDTLETLSDQLDTVDSNVDAVLVDTGTTLPALIAALNDVTVAEILAGSIESGIDLQATMRALLAVAVGQATGLNGLAQTAFKDAAGGGTTRVAGTLDPSAGTRSAPTLNL